MARCGLGVATGRDSSSLNKKDGGVSQDHGEWHTGRDSASVRRH